jgi:hypothetical protein
MERTTISGPHETAPTDVDSPAERPGVPMESRTRRVEGAPPSQPPRQHVTEPHFKRVGLDELTPVVGTAQPPRGISGAMRGLAYQLPEHQARHWLLLMAADRVDVLEHRLAGPLRATGMGLAAAAGAATVAMTLWRGRTRSVKGDLARGMAAGAAATWVMGQVTTLLYERERPSVRQREERVRGGMSAHERAAEEGAALLGTRLDARQRRQAATALHWGTGMAAGALYGVLRGRLPLSGMLRGLGFGTAFFLLVDEGANAALGITPPPLVFPWQAHARGLAGHLAFGATADAALDVLERVT